QFDAPRADGRTLSRRDVRRPHHRRLGGAHIHCSRDGGKTWRSSNEMAVEALAVAGGAIYAAAAGHLYVSQDCAQSWKTLTPQIPAGWRARSIAVDRQSIYMSVRAAREPHR